MALVLSSLPYAALTLGPLLGHLMGMEVPVVHAMLALEYMAEKVSGMYQLGTGRVQATPCHNLVLRAI